MKISWRSPHVNPSAGGVKHKRGSQVERFWTYRRLYLGNGARFLLVPKSVTLNDLERRNGRFLRYFIEFG